LISLPIAVGILTKTLWASFTSKEDVKGGPVLQAVIPGVNLPFSQIFFYIIAIAISSIFHEIGHGLAASAAGIQVESCGVIFFILIPVAFVELSTDSYSRSDPKTKLQVVCAGIWHNYILAVICFILLLGQPILWSPFCFQGNGVSIVSSLNGKGSLMRGDVVQSVNECIVNDRQTWIKCFNSTSNSEISGYCLSAHLVENIGYKAADISDTCCPINDKISGICFSQQSDRYCLPVRKVIADYEKNCSTDTECPPTSSCFKPNEDPTGSSRLFILKRYNKEEYLFYGKSNELLMSTTILECAVKSRPPFSITMVFFIYFLDELLRFLVAFSLALGVLNVIPSFFLDGYHIMSSLMETALFVPYLERNTQQKVVKFISFLGSILLLTSVIRATTNVV
jgi:S2P endopeptidase